MFLQAKIQVFFFLKSTYLGVKDLYYQDVNMNSKTFNNTSIPRSICPVNTDK